LLKKSPKFLKDTSWPPSTLRLDRVTSAVGHVLFYYLLTDTYQCLRPKGASRHEKIVDEITTGIRVYVAAREYELLPLQKFAEHEIRRLADELPFTLVLNLFQEFDLKPTAEDTWVSDYVQLGLKSLFENPRALLEYSDPQVTPDVVSFSDIILKNLAELLAINSAPVRRDTVVQSAQSIEPAIPESEAESKRKMKKTKKMKKMKKSFPGDDELPVSTITKSDPEPCTQEPCAEEPCAEELCAQEAYAEEACAEELYAQEACAEELCAEELCAEELCAQEAYAEEACAEELYAQEACAEELYAQEACAEEACAEEPYAQDLCAEEAYAEVACAKEPYAQEACAEEPCAQESPIPEPSNIELEPSVDLVKEDRVPDDFWGWGFSQRERERERAKLQAMAS
jgi:hypothetical protein